jgi:uncharacterized coiled-coil DUF342 family protein
MGETDELSDLRALLQQAMAERDAAREQVREMIQKAADQKLDGYRELGERAAQAENARDAAQAECRRLRETLQRISEWDSLNPPAPNSDFPWLKQLVDTALTGKGS